MEDPDVDLPINNMHNYGKPQITHEFLTKN